jgi:Flp pilus assembly protein TadD
MRYICFFIGIFFYLETNAQDSLQSVAKNYIRQGDYQNAILVLNRAAEAAPGNIELKKDLGFAYYLSRDYTNALSTAKSITESDNADVQSYQLLGMVYKAIEEKKEALKMYRSAIRKFPKSGALLNEYGEVLLANKDEGDAIKQWQRGIERDPEYSGNYYNAAKYYHQTPDKVWALIYGEIFVNLESYSKRTPEIKTLLLEGYKKLFAETNLYKGQDSQNPFVNAFLETMKNQSQVINAGISPDALSALRTRFLLEWFNKFASRFPFRLFEYQQQLVREGMFDAYNQWIFGAANNLQAFQLWCANHAEEYNRFVNFQKGRVLKLPEGQYYQGR